MRRKPKRGTKPALRMAARRSRIRLASAQMALISLIFVTPMATSSSGLPGKLPDLIGQQKNLRRAVLSGRFFRSVDGEPRLFAHLANREPGIGFADDSPQEDGGFEPVVPPQRQHNRGTGPMSPTASIRVGLVIPLANSISIPVASGTSGSNPLCSSGESPANSVPRL